MFFFSDTATTDIYTLSLHDALPIFLCRLAIRCQGRHLYPTPSFDYGIFDLDRKSTRLNSSHVAISYAVFCLKKKKISTHGSSRMARTDRAVLRRRRRTAPRPLPSRL